MERKEAEVHQVKVGLAVPQAQLVQQDLGALRVLMELASKETKERAVSQAWMVHKVL